MGIDNATPVEMASFIIRKKPSWDAFIERYPSVYYGPENHALAVKMALHWLQLQEVQHRSSTGPAKGAATSC